jgi:hypothetical protein
MAKGSSKDNPTQGWDNPFFRNYEGEFKGGDMEIMSPVDSIFMESRVSSKPNVMEEVLREQAPGHAKKVVKGGK